MTDWWRTAAPASPTASNRVRLVPIKLGRTESQLNLIQFTAGISCELEKAKQITMTRCRNASGAADKKMKRGKNDKQEEEEVEDATLTYVGQQDKQKTFKGAPGGGVKDNSAFYVLRLVDGKYIEAYPVNQWISYSPMSTVKSLDYDQIQQEYENRNKHHSRWYLKAKLRSNTSTAEEKEETAESEKGRVAKEGSKLTLVEADEWIGSDDENTMDQSSWGDISKSHAVTKATKKKANVKAKAVTNKSGRFRRAAERLNSESEFTEESDDGDRDADEVDYSDDESSSASAEFEEEEEKGIDQEVLPQKTEAGENDESPNEDEDQLTEEGKELARLLNEYESIDKAANGDSDFDSSESSSDIEQKLEKSLKSSCVLLLEGSQKNQKQQLKRSSGTTSNSVKRKRTTKKEPNGGVK